MTTHTTRTVCCNITGVQLAVIHLSQSALSCGPTQLWQSQWNAMIMQHPYFGLTRNALLRTARIKLRELGKLDAELLFTNSPETEPARVAFTAVLRSMGVVMRNEGSTNLPYMLPTAATALKHAQQLLGLAYWYANNKSPKFKFPSINIAKINRNTELDDIGSYLSICQLQKDAWIAEEKATAEALAKRMLGLADTLRSDEDYLVAANKAERAVASSHSKRVTREQLWNWLQACIMADGAESLAKWKESGDQQYFAEMFLSARGAWKRYTPDEIDSLEDVLMGFAPLGSAPFHEFRAKLAEMTAEITKNTKAFTVDWSSVVVSSADTNAVGVTPTGEVKLTAEQEELLAQPEPTAATHPDKVQLIRALAKWRLAKAKHEELKRIALRKSII